MSTNLPSTQDQPQTQARLFWKFLLAFWLSLVLAGIGVGGAVSLYHQQRTGPSAEISTSTHSAMSITTVAAIVRYGGAEAMRDVMRERQSNNRLRVFVVGEDDRDLIDRPVSVGALREARRAVASDPEGHSAQLVAAPDGKSYLIFVPLQKSGAGGLRWRRDPLPPVELMATGLLASLVVSVLLAWYLSKPIRNLRWAFSAISRGKLDTRVGPLMGSRRDEIADLGREFDAMAQKLHDLIGAQRQLLHDVSHEIRSPLARLQAAIGLARQNPDHLQETLARVEHEGERLDQLIGELLTLSRLDSPTPGAPQETIDLMELVAEICEDARFEAEASGRKLEYSCVGNAVSRVQAELIYRAIENVVRNAVKYSPPGGQVEVEAIERPAGRLLLRVLDRGPGVAEEDLPHIFEPFFRGVRDSVDHGFGLGLAIARRAIDAHGGSIAITNREGGGLAVEISLPLSGE